MKIIGIMKTAPENKDKIYGVITATDNQMWCKDCETVFEFSDDEIDHTKALPHIKCPKCSKELQLPAKYMRKGE